MSIPSELRSCPLFYEMYEKEIKKIASRGLVGFYKPGDFVVRDGETGEEIYVVLEGQLMVRKNTSEGLLDIAPLSKGDVFGEMVLLDEKIRSADIVSIEPSWVLELSYRQIFDVYEKEPRIFGVMLLNLARLLAKRLRSTNKIIVDLKKHLTPEQK
ncbi:MAG: cyclic nucleotide-binding domain-containing protein [Deltaproteobacteria bacterium]|nr:cyclic nucleotide-binding domain-containing protein [Deltaproteobacteria bacterium]